mgnify:CR=1 FL=1
MLTVFTDFVSSIFILEKLNIENNNHHKPAKVIAIISNNSTASGLKLNGKFKKIIIPELNTGQLLKLVREAFLVDARGINKVSGETFTAQELTDKIEEIINE